MDSVTRKKVWLGVVLVVGAVLAFGAPTIIAGITDTGVASAQCGMDHSSSGGCSMGDTHSSTAANAKTAHHGMVMLVGTATSIDKSNGSVTIRLKPGKDAADAKKALKQVKLGDSLSLVLMLTKDGRPALADSKPTAPVAAYSCPMHPEVTSAHAGSCPKCGMNLEKTGH